MKLGRIVFAALLIHLAAWSPVPLVAQRLQAREARKTVLISANTNLAYEPVSLAVAPPDPQVTPPNVHGITLSWGAPSSGSPNVYNVYDATVSGGPYTKIGSVSSTTTSFFFPTPNSGGVKFFFVVRWADNLGIESPNSNEGSATAIGNPSNPPTGLAAVSQ